MHTDETVAQATEEHKMANPTKQANQSKPKQGDHTGRQRAELQAQQEKAAKERQEALTMANAQQQVVDEKSIHDPLSGRVLADEFDPETHTRAEALDLGVETTVRPDTVVIRLNEDINPTIGAGKHYQFEAGKQYEVPLNVAQVLEEKGYVWH